VPNSMIAEIVDGDLYTSPRPAIAHANAASGIAAALRRPFHGHGGGDGGPGGWWILFEPEIHLGADVLVPDLAAWTIERMPKLPDAAFLDLAPDWVCEIISPSTGSIDRVLKMRIYGSEQVRHLWLVDPLQQTLEIYRRDADRWIVVATHSGVDLIRAEPFDDITVDLSTWWL